MSIGSRYVNKGSVSQLLYRVCIESQVETADLILQLLVYGGFRLIRSKVRAISLRIVAPPFFTGEVVIKPYSSIQLVAGSFVNGDSPYCPGKVVQHVYSAYGRYSLIDTVNSGFSQLLLDFCRNQSSLEAVLLSRVSEHETHLRDELIRQHPDSDKIFNL